MNQSHYPDLERCKKLTELGFPDTEAEWHLLIEENDMVISRMTSTMNELFSTSEKIPTGNYVCPSVMEIMDVLPTKLPSGGHRTIVAYEKYSQVFYGRDFRGFVKGTLPNALADLTIWLVENGHITFDKR